MIKHPLARALLALKGNPRACVYTEPLWGIPFNLYMPFVSVYMSALLLTDRQIGAVASIALLFRAVSALLSGAITDKLGRKKTTLIFDLISWSVPCLLWALSQNFWWFFVAAACNGLYQITDTSWTCLLVEDADKNVMVDIYSWIHISGQLAVFFAPLSGLLVERLTVIPAMRILFFFSLLSMTAKFVLLFRYCEETKTGVIRKRETKGMSLFTILSGYGKVVRILLESPPMLLILAVNTFFTIATMIMHNYFGLYTTQNMGMPQHYLALFPIIRSVIMLGFLFGIQGRLARFGYKAPMLAGIALYVTSHVVLIFSPIQTALTPVIYAVLEACAHGLVMPRKDSIAALFIDPKERARIISIITVAVLVVSIPFGYFSGWLSDLDRRLPFLLNILIFMLSFFVISRSKSLSAVTIAEE